MFSYHVFCCAIHEASWQEILAHLNEISASFFFFLSFHIKAVSFADVNKAEMHSDPRVLLNVKHIARMCFLVWPAIIYMPPVVLECFHVYHSALRR